MLTFVTAAVEVDARPIERPPSPSIHIRRVSKPVPECLAWIYEGHNERATVRSRAQADRRDHVRMRGSSARAILQQDLLWETSRRELQCDQGAAQKTRAHDGGAA